MTTVNQVGVGLSGSSGSGSFAGTISPTFVTPVLGTPSSGTLSSCTGYAQSSLTGLATGISTWLGTPSSANLLSAMTTKTGTGSLVFGTSPTLTTPSIAQINDSSGNAAIALSAVGAANYWTFSNSGALASIGVAATGSDNNIDVVHNTKGTGQFKISAWNSTQPIIINSNTSGTHVSTFNFATSAGTNNFTFPDASGTLLITGTAINSVPSITFSSTSGVIGTTTNDNAATGSVGEYVSSSVATNAVSLSTGTVANVTSISLTAGDWDVYGNLAFTGGASTLTVYTQGAISTTSASLPSNQFFTGQFYSAAGSAVYATAGSSFVVPTLRVSIAGTTTVYICAQSGFNTSTTTVGGAIYARRRR